MTTGETVFPAKRAIIRRTVWRSDDPATFWFAHDHGIGNTDPQSRTQGREYMSDYLDPTAFPFTVDEVRAGVPLLAPE